MVRIFTYSISVKRSLALLSVVFAVGVARLSAQTYLPAPYYNGFETGSLGAEWTTFSSQPGINIEVIQSGTLVWNTEVAMAYAGNYFLGMDFGTGGTYNLNQANLHLNLAGASILGLSFSGRNGTMKPSHRMEFLFQMMEERIMLKYLTSMVRVIRIIPTLTSI